MTELSATSHAQTAPAATSAVPSEPSAPSPSVSSPSASSAKRYAFMDVLNVVAIFAVMLLHCSNNVSDMQLDAAWDVAVVYQCVAIFAVPIFFMVSGANLLGYRERYSTATFFKKRALRVVLTLVIWSAVMYVLLCFCSDLFGYEPRRFGLGEFVKELLRNNVVRIFWFFYVIIGLYLVTPLFSLIVTHKRTLKYTIVLAAVMSFVVPTVEAFLPDASYAIDPYKLNFFTWALTYYLLGYYLTHYVKRTFAPGALVGVCVVCVAAMIGLTYWLNAGNAGGEYNNLFAAAEGLPTLFYAPAIFLLFKQAEDKLARAKAYPVFRKLSGLSLKVYAIHIAFVWTFDTLVLSLVEANSAPALLLQFIVEPIVAYACALLVAWVVERAKRAIKTRFAGRGTA